MRLIRPIRQIKKVFFFTLLALCIGIFAFWKFSQPAVASWFNDSWAYRTALTINNTGSADANKKVKFDIDTSALITAGKMQSDCDDSRFTDINGNLLDYFIDSDAGACNTTSTDYYIKVPTINAGATIIYHYYGNPSAINAQSPDLFLNNSTLASKLRAYWKFEEASGTRYDLARDINLTDNNTVTSTTGKLGNAARMVRTSSEYLSSTSSVLSPGDQNWAMSFWVNLSTKTNVMVIVGKVGTPWSAPYPAEYQFYYDNAADRFKFELYQRSDANSVTATADSLGAVSTGTWYHVYMEYNASTDTIGLSINNGTLDTASTASITPSTSSAEFDIGRRALDGNYYNGAFDSFGMWVGRTLTSIERNTLYNSGSGYDLDITATFTPSSTSAATEEKGPGPRLSWHFDDGQSTNANDSSSNNLDGTLNNTPTWQTEDLCISGKCLYFDGTNNENVSKADDPLLDFGTGSFSVSAWVKRNGTSSANNVILTKSTANIGATYTGYKLYMDASGDLCFNTQDGTNAVDTACTSAVDFDDDKWHYVTGVKNGTTSLTLYVDGKSRATDSSIASTATLSNASTFYAGVDSDGTTTEWLGFIDEVKVYDFALSANEVKANFNSRGSVKGVSAQMGGAEQKYLSDGLVGYWKMNDNVSGDAQSLVDASGNVRTATTHYGANTTGMDCTGTGKYGQGCTFDGTDDYVTTTLSGLIDTNTPSFSLSAWVKPLSTLVGSDLIFGKLGYHAGITGGSSTTSITCSIANTGNSMFNTTSYTISLNSWYHFTCVYDKDKSKLILYVNGNYSADVAVTGDIFNYNNTLYIGGNAVPQAPNVTMDEARVYNRALSPKEVSDLANFAPGPVGYWKLDEKSGTAAADNSGNSNEATLTNTPTWTTGKYGAAVNFAGSDQHITRADDADFDFADDADMSFEAWIKHDTQTSGTEVIMSKFNEAGYKITMETDGDIQCGLDYDNTWTPTDSAISTAATYDDNAWHHVACVKSGASTLSLYIDGILIATDSSITATNTLTNSDPLYIGIDADGTSNDWIGKIDEPKIYNYARSAKQIISDMNAGHPSVGSPIGSAVGYWKFNEGTNDSCSGGSNDVCNSGSGGNTLDGTIAGMTVPATATSGWTNAGKFGRALNFDGSGDYVNIPDNATLRPGTSDFTTSFWFKAADANQSGALLAKRLGSGTFDQWQITTGTIGSGGTITSSKKLSVFLINNGVVDWISYATTNDVIDGNWHHVVVTRVGSTDTITMYIDGKNAPLTLVGSNGSIPHNVDNTQPWRVGNDNGTSYFTGQIDEVKIYNYTLTADEVKTEYNQGQSIQLGAAGNNSTYQIGAANQEYCVPGDATSCAAPILRYDFEERLGATTTADTSGGGYTGTWGGTGTHQTIGKIGKGGKFTSPPGDNLDIGNLGLSGSGSFTIEGWINVPTGGTFDCSMSGDPSTYSGAIFDFGAEVNFQSIGLAFCSTGFSRTEYIAAQGYGFTYGTASSTISRNTWTHVALVYSGGAVSTGTTIYINGVSQTLSNLQATDGTLNLSNTNYGMGYERRGPRAYFSGSVDNFRVFNYARSAAQIAYDYNRGGPVAWWKFNECQGLVANDSSGNSNTGTITIGTGAGAGQQDSAGTCTTSAATAWYNGATGKRNASLNLDGIDDYVSTADSTSLRLSPSNQASFSWWYKSSSYPANNSAFFEKFDASDILNGYYIWTNNTTGRIFFSVANAGTYSTAKNSPDQWISNDNLWHHYVVVWTNNTVNGSKFYKDGVLSSQQDSANLAMGTNDGTLYLGRSNYNNVDVVGSFDDVKIFNYALTATQVKNEYNGGAINYAPITGTP